MRGFLYKTYARPILMYGVETSTLNQKEQTILKRTKGNTVKRLLGLSTKLRSTHLLAALGLEPLLDKIQREKCGFFLRLSKNSLTRRLTNEIITLNLTGTRGTRGLHDEIASMCTPAASMTPCRPEWQLLHPSYARLLSACHEIIDENKKKKKELLSHGVTHSTQTALRTDGTLVRLLAKSFPSERRQEIEAIGGLEGLENIFENIDN